MKNNMSSPINSHPHLPNDGSMPFYAFVIFYAGSQCGRYATHDSYR